MGRDTPGGLMVLLLAIFLLTSYFTGRLDWLFRLKADVTGAAKGEPTAAATAPQRVFVGAKLGGAPLTRPRLEPRGLVLA